MLGGSNGEIPKSDSIGVKILESSKEKRKVQEKS